MDKLLYGAAYYDEYMPYERLEKDVEMLKRAGMNVVRIAESTWSTLEPVDGTFDFTSVDRTLDAMHAGGIHVIVGTPTYAVPAWLVRKDPDVLATTKEGRGLYGPRQIMDITNETYLFHAERVIRELMAHVAGHPAVIGYQLDNETKHYDTAGPKVQARFVEYLKKKFHGDIEEMNRRFGLNYWSNAVHDWADFPDVRNTINGSLGGEFSRFQRQLVTEFLLWQRKIVDEYRREDQFVTHNFDFGWRGFSYGVQPDVNHFEASKALTVAGCDIYHPSQDQLTGVEIAFCGALTYGLKKQNYYIMETEAQGFANWTPLDGQLRLLAFSHLGSGADMVEYWHWHSIHNAEETYWKGVLSHDFSENHVYREACTIGADFARLSPELLHLRKENRIALMVNNESLTGLSRFKSRGGYVDYNETIMPVYEALYEQNFECDIIPAETEDLSRYSAVVVPAMYCASEDTLRRLDSYTKNGGLLIGTFKTAFANEETTVYPDTQPHFLHDAFGIRYNQFSWTERIGIVSSEESSDPDVSAALFENTEAVQGFFECVETDGAEVLARYDHYNWGQYAAVTRNHYGSGMSYYIACMLPKNVLKTVLRSALQAAGVESGTENVFPVIEKRGVNQKGNKIIFLYNYSAKEQKAACPKDASVYTELLSGEKVTAGEILKLQRWDFRILRAER